MPLPRFAFISLLLTSITWLAAGSTPNIVFILADDLGYGDVKSLNPESKIPTPNIDRLAAEGMTFTDAHSPSAVCTPTRYAALTGRYSWRSKLKRGVLNGYGEPLIETDRPTVASHLRDNGYMTGVVGKWHLGLGFQKDGDEYAWHKPVTYSPVDVGFEHSLVIPASLDFPPYVYIDGHKITGLPDRTQPKQSFPASLRQGELGSNFSMEDCLDELTHEATEFIAQRADGDSPFLLYYPLTAPHKPVWPHHRFRGTTDLGPYGDFIVQVDWTVGQVLDAIDDAGIADDTVVILTSDNGSFMYRLTDANETDHVADESVQAYYEGNHTANGPWRGTKADIWEAGHRVPFFARWPGKIEAGSASAEPICHVDFFATAAKLAGTKLPAAAEAAPDSFDLTPLMFGQSSDFKRAPVIHHSSGGMFAIREGDWKLILGAGSGGRQAPKGKRFEPPWQLFNLANDPGETNNLFTTNPQKAHELEGKLFQILADDRSR
ncbi:arylsulfatase [Opitutaceae bacterium]|nr:arylsulfatase [Opitutaceae bacterium]